MMMMMMMMTASAASQSKHWSTARWETLYVRATGNGRLLGGVREFLDVIPSKVPLFRGGCRPHLVHSSLGPNGISIGSADFAGLTVVTDRPTEHTTLSVAIGHI